MGHRNDLTVEDIPEEADLAVALPDILEGASEPHLGSANRKSTDNLQLAAPEHETDQSHVDDLSADEHKTAHSDGDNETEKSETTITCTMRRSLSANLRRKSKGGHRQGLGSQSGWISLYFWFYHLPYMLFENWLPHLPLFAEQSLCRRRKVVI